MEEEPMARSYPATLATLLRTCRLFPRIFPRLFYSTYSLLFTFFVFQPLHWKSNLIRCVIWREKIGMILARFYAPEVVAWLPMRSQWGQFWLEIARFSSHDWDSFGFGMPIFGWNWLKFGWNWLIFGWNWWKFGWNWLIFGWNWWKFGFNWLKFGWNLAEIDVKCQFWMKVD